MQTYWEVPTFWFHIYILLRFIIQNWRCNAHLTFVYSFSVPYLNKLWFHYASWESGSEKINKTKYIRIQSVRAVAKFKIAYLMIQKLFINMYQVSPNRSRKRTNLEFGQIVERTLHCLLWSLRVLSHFVFCPLRQYIIHSVPGIASIYIKTTL